MPVTERRVLDRFGKSDVYLLIRMVVSIGSRRRIEILNGVFHQKGRKLAWANPGPTRATTLGPIFEVFPDLDCKGNLPL